MTEAYQLGNILDRPYDIVLPPNLLSKARENRFTPGGELKEVRNTKRGGITVAKYPWAAMEMGDFFITVIGDRSEKAMRVGFYQSAARHDYEIAIKPVRGPQGEDCLRVTLILVGVTNWKVKLERFLDQDAKSAKPKYQHVPRPRYSDGKWKGRRRGWEKERQAKRGPRRNPNSGGDYSTRGEWRETVAEKRKRDPFWADSEEATLGTPLLEPIAPPVVELTVEPEVKLSREEVIARARRLAGES